MRISVIGCGYLGAVHAAAMASIGHDVVGIDVNAGRIDDLAQGKAPFFEPELPELLRSGIASGRLSFSTEVSSAAGARAHFVAVGTPQSSNGSKADLRYVDDAFVSLAPFLNPGDVVVGKSTVPVGTAQRLSAIVDERQAVLAWNPEFLREGFAVQDTIDPDRIVVGVADGDSRNVAADTLREVYYPAVSAGTPFLVTNFPTAELVKGAANAFLATKISFINAMSEISEVVGADVTQLADAIGHDERIGRKFLGAGLGFGGGCLPKDIRAFAARAEELGVGSAVKFLYEVDEINLRRREQTVQLVISSLRGNPKGRKVAILGAAFKPNSDDVRDSPALDVAARLHSLGAEVVVTDPQAIENARRQHPELNFEPDVMLALQDADCVVVATEWDVFTKELSPQTSSALVRDKNIVDTRNCLAPREWLSNGWNFTALGRL